MSKDLLPAWTTAKKLLETTEPCDIIEIFYAKCKPPVSHFVFNIRKGWCVNVIRAVDTSDNVLQSGRDKEDNDSTSIYEGFKDAVDLVGLAGRNPCRINNLDDIVKSYSLTPRSRRDALQIARAGLAEGAIISTIRSNIPGNPSSGEDISKLFCLYWKYNGAACEGDFGFKFLDKVHKYLRSFNKNTSFYFLILLIFYLLADYCCLWVSSGPTGCCCSYIVKYVTLLFIPSV